MLQYPNGRAPEVQTSGIMNPRSNFWVGKDPNAVNYFLRDIERLVKSIIHGQVS